MKSKIDDLINGQVSSGKLTSDQATELQGVFKAAFANGPGGAGPGGPGGPGGAGGPRPAAMAVRRPSDSASSSDDSSSSTTSIDDILKQFLQSLQESAVGLVIHVLQRHRQFEHIEHSSASFSALLIDYQS